MSTEPTQHGTFQAKLANLGEHLDQLASRATRAAAALRTDTGAALDDVKGWRAHLEALRVDAELARMDARDDVAAARDRLREQRDAVGRRLDEAAGATAEAWRALRHGIDEALEDLRLTLGEATGTRA